MGKREELRKYLNKHQNVNSLYKINSGYDFLIELVFKNIKELEDFMENIRDRFKIIEDNVFYILEDIKREDFMNDENILRNCLFDDYTEKCQYANLKVGDIDISGRTPP